MSFVTGLLWSLTRDALATAGEHGGYVVYETLGADRGGEECHGLSHSAEELVGQE